jgi:hypothetical protein
VKLILRKLISTDVNYFNIIRIREKVAKYDFFLGTLLGNRKGYDSKWN